MSRYGDTPPIIEAVWPAWREVRLLEWWWRESQRIVWGCGIPGHVLNQRGSTEAQEQPRE